MPRPGEPQVGTAALPGGDSLVPFELPCFAPFGVLGLQRRKRRGIRAIFPPRGRGGITREIVPASSPACAQAAHSLQIPGDVRLDASDFAGIEIDLVHPLRQQIGRAWPPAGKRAEIPLADADIVRHPRRFRRTAAIEGHHCPAPSAPVSPLTGKPTKHGLSGVGHIALRPLYPNRVTKRSRTPRGCPAGARSFPTRVQPRQGDRARHALRARFQPRQPWPAARCLR